MATVSSGPKFVQVLIEKRENVAASYIYITSGEACDYVVFNLKPNNLLFRFFSAAKCTHTLDIVSPPNTFSSKGFCVDTGDLLKLSICRETNELTAKFINKQSENIEDTLSDLHLENKRKLFKVVFRLKSGNSEEVTNILHSPKHTHLQANTPYNISCASCRHKLTKDVVSFPAISKASVDLDEISENFFCHKRNVTFEFKENALLYNAVSYSLNCIDTENIYKNKARGVFCCRNCDSAFSTKVKHDNNIWCYKDKVVFEAVGSEEEEINFVSIASDILVNLLETSLETSPIVKIYLEPEGDENMGCLLIWLLNPCLQRASYMLTDNHSVTEELKFTSTMQVLYQIVSRDSDIASQWRRNFTVDFHCISDTMYKNMCHLLKEGDCSDEVANTIKGFRTSYVANN